MAKQHDICEGVVDGEDSHGGKDALQDGTEDVEDIAEEPDDDEKKGQAIGGGAAEVLDDLGGKDDDPAGYGYGAVEKMSVLVIAWVGRVVVDSPANTTDCIYVKAKS